MIKINWPIRGAESPDESNKAISAIDGVVKYEQHGTIRLVTIKKWTDEHGLMSRIAKTGTNPDGMIVVRPGTEWRKVDYVAYIGHEGSFRLIDNAQIEADLPKWSTWLINAIKLEVANVHGHGHENSHQGHHGIHNHWLHTKRWNFKGFSDGH